MPHIRTPRTGLEAPEHEKTVQPAGGAKTPSRKPDHDLPALDIPRISGEIAEAATPNEKSSSSHGPIDRNSESGSASTSLMPFLMTNFSKIHEANSLIMARLRIAEDRSIGSLGYAQLVSSASKSTTRSTPLARDSTLSNVVKVDSRAPSLASCVGTSKSKIGSPYTTKSLESLPENQVMSITSSSSMFERIRSRHVEMEQLTKIIRTHSKRVLLRNDSKAQRIWEFLENRTSSGWAYFYGSYFAPFFLVVSVLISLSQTVDSFAIPDKVFMVIQTGFELWFGCEIVLRFAVCPNKLEFWFGIFNWIDFVSVAPVFLRIYVLAQNIEREDGVLLQVIALVPMLRILKLLRRFQKFQLLISAFAMAFEALPVLIFSLMLIAIMFSGVIFLCESRELIPDLPTALWFVMVTMTTVGYGDIVPETIAGQVLSALLMILSALYMALPIGIVGNVFNEVWKDRDRLLLYAVLRESFAISGISKGLIADLFDHFSIHSDYSDSRDPEVGFSDFQAMMRAFQIDMSEERLFALFAALDDDENGKISCDEFMHKLFPIQFRSTTVYGAGSRMDIKESSWFGFRWR